MIAYKRTWLDNLYIHHQLDDAFHEQYISKEEMETCKKNYMVGFYSPNFFIRIGLFLLTTIIFIFAYGLFLLLLFSAGSNDAGGGVMCVTFGVIAYVVLEFMVRKNHFRSGVDDALLWIAAVLIVTGINIWTNISSVGNAVLIFAIASYLSLRFMDAVMSAVACLACLSVFFFSYTKMGPVAKASAPFLIMIVSAAIYFLTDKQTNRHKYLHYTNCFLLLKISALICFYCAANYYVVREVSNEMFHLQLREGETIPFGWLFWILTVLIPIVYITRGIQKKDFVLLRVGLVLIAAIIFTVRYYYHILPLEMAMIIGGMIMIGISYMLIRYLGKPKYGFSSTESFRRDTMGTIQIESIIISEIAGSTEQPATSETRFGGGSGSGGGAGGEY
jgi:hypothetical protein